MLVKCQPFQLNTKEHLIYILDMSWQKPSQEYFVHASSGITIASKKTMEFHLKQVHQDHLSLLDFFFFNVRLNVHG